MNGKMSASIEDALKILNEAVSRAKEGNGPVAREKIDTVSKLVERYGPQYRDIVTRLKKQKRELETGGLYSYNPSGAVEGIENIISSIKDEAHVTA